MAGETVTTENRARILPSSGLSTGDADQKTGFVNSAWVEAAKVEGTQAQSVAESGSTNVTETLSIQPLTKSETFCGYSIDELRKYLRPSCDNIDDLSNDQIMALAEKNLNIQLSELENNLNNEIFKYSYIFTDEQKEIFDELFPGEDGLKKAIIEAFFDVNEVFCAISLLEDRKNSGINFDSVESHKYYQMRAYSCIMDSDSDNDRDREVLDVLIKDLNNPENSLKQKQNELEHYILPRLNFVSDLPEEYVPTYIKNVVLEIISKVEDSAVKQLIFDIVKNNIKSNNVNNANNENDEYWDQIQVDLIDKLINTYETPEEKCQLISQIDDKALVENIQLFRYIIDFLTDENSPLYQCFEPAEREILQSVLRGENVEEAEIAKVVDKFKSINFNRIYSNTMTARIVHEANGDISEEEIGEKLDGFERIIGEEGMREVWTKVYESFEQNPEWLENIDGDKFQEVVGRISHDNYGIIVDDILRGDGVQTPLNMPEMNSGSGVETGSGNGSSSGAQDPSTGFFSVPSQQIIANVQNNINQLNQSIAQASATDNSPKPVQQETTVNTSKGIDSILTSDGNDLVDAVKTYIQKEGVVSFVKDAFNSSVAMKNTYIKQKALNFFENVIPKATRLLTFDKGIHNSANAELAARTMTADELSQVHAQNQYLAERIEAIKEEKEKQQGLA